MVKRVGCFLRKKRARRQLCISADFCLFLKSHSKKSYKQMPMVYASKKFWNQFLDLHSYLSILEILYEQICNCCVNTVHCRNQYYFKKDVLQRLFTILHFWKFWGACHWVLPYETFHELISKQNIMKKLGSQLLTISRGLAMCCLLTLPVYRCLTTSTAFHPYRRRSRPGIFMCLCAHRAVDELV